jgi:beta-phosphoglucomutase-like phosphatase (HAD superfamily)
MHRFESPSAGQARPVAAVVVGSSLVIRQFRDLDPFDVRVLLVDADGNLFPSEEPAFAASAEVTNAFLASVGVAARFTAEELRLATTGKNFRTTARDLCLAHGVTDLDPDVLEYWVAEEKRQVSAHLGQVLRPDPRVLGPLGMLASRFLLAVVSSSAMSRLDACFTATGLTTLLPPEYRYSAEDSLPVPISKPDPAVYLWAAARVGGGAGGRLAVEDSVPGAQSAVAAGLPTVGNLMFVPEGERAERIEALRAARVCAVVDSWAEMADLLDGVETPDNVVTASRPA